MYDGQVFTPIKAKISEVKAVVAAFHSLPVSALESGCRKRTWAWPRQEAMKLARELTDASYPQIARHFGGRDHTTCLYAYRKITDREGDDPKLAERLRICRERIAELVQKRVAASGASTPWSPPPPMALAKPASISATFDVVAWQRLGGELEAVG